jgi:hypothetical protein
MAAGPLGTAGAGNGVNPQTAVRGAAKQLEDNIEAIDAAEDAGAGAVADPEPQYTPDGQPDRGPAAWVNVEDENGDVGTYSSSPGAHAEVNAQLAEPGGSRSRVWGWRGPTSNPVWRRFQSA